MPTVNDVVKYLSSEKDLSCSRQVVLSHPDRALTGAAHFSQAGEQDLAWLSPKVAGGVAKNMESFQGGLLISSDQANPALLSSPNVLACAQPKLAFIKAINRFLPELAEIKWPESGEGNIAAGSRVDPGARLAPGVVIGSGCIIENEVSIGPNTVLANCTVHSGSSIGPNCSIGMPGFGYAQDEQGRWWRLPHLGRVVIGPGVEIGSNVCIDRGGLSDTVVEQGVKIDNLVHLAHNVVVGRDSLLIAHANLGGSVEIGKGAWIALSATIMNQLKVGDGAMVGLGASVFRNVKPNTSVMGNPAFRMKGDDGQSGE